MAREESGCRSVVQPNHSVNEHQPLPGPERPALGQHQVIDIFQADPGQLTENIERMQHLLQVHEAYVPGDFLLLAYRFRRRRGGPMPSTGVKVDEINFCHYCFIAASYPCYARALKR